MTPRRWLLAAIGAAAVVLLVGRWVSQSVADYRWHQALGAGSLWWGKTGALVALVAACWIAATAFAFANLYAVRHSVVSLVLPRRVANIEFGEEVPGRYLMGAVIALSAAVGALLAALQRDWVGFLLARFGVIFGESDPYLNADLGFYVYWLPFERGMWSWSVNVVLVVAVLVILLYALTPSLRVERGSLYVSGYVRRHFTVLVGIMLLLVAWSFRLDMYGMLGQGRGADGAFTYLDHRIGLPGHLVLSLATLGAALIVVWTGWTGQLKLAASAILGTLLLSVVVRHVAPLMVARSATERDPVARERAYVATRAGYTRRAYRVAELPLMDPELAAPSLASMARGLSQWDPPALVRALAGGRLVDPALSTVGWRPSPAGLVAEVVQRPHAANEDPRAEWNVMRVLAAAADDAGEPLRMPAPGSTRLAQPSEDVAIRPALVFEGAGSYAVLADTLGMITGVSLEGFGARLAHAWSLQNFRFIFGDLPQPRPTIVRHRAVRDRLGRLYPFFVQGTELVPVVLGDDLFWALDLYAASASYPLSRRAIAASREVGYFQHAATAVVRASSGEVVVVPDSVLDPVATTWVRRFPELFGTWESLPPGLRDLLPPESDGVRVQAVAFGRFGSRQDSDVPKIPPVLDGADSALAAGGDPRFLLGGTGATSIAVPLVDQNDRLRGLVIGTGGTERRTLWMPLAEPGPRWQAVLDGLRLPDTGTFSPRGTPRAHGRVRSVPVRNGAELAIAHVQPVYAWRPGGNPGLLGVRVAVGDSVWTVPSLAALTAGLPSGPLGLAPGDFRAQVSALHDAMREAMRRGDWSAFGRAFDALGRLLAEPR